MMKSKTARSAFTLVELLVVIAIIGILASLILAAVARVKQRSQETICLNNLRQIGVAMKLYQDDNQNRLPLRISMKGSSGMPPQDPATAADWNDFSHAIGGKDGGPGTKLAPARERPLFPYIKNPETFHCLADQGWEDKPRNRSVRPSYWSVFGCSYSYNTTRSGAPTRADIGTPGLANKSGDLVSKPSLFVLVYERPAAVDGTEAPIILWHRAKNSESLLLSEHYAKGRELVAPFLFLDGRTQVLVFKKGETPWKSSRVVWN